jgi:cytochrome c
MHIFGKMLTGAFLAISLQVSALAADGRASADEAMAMVKKAQAYLKANGQEKAIAAFNNPKGEFADRDLYIFLMDMSGKLHAHGGNARLIGKNIAEVKDSDEKQFVKYFIETAKGKGSGWVDYKWPNPVNLQIEQKSTYIEKAGDMMLGCGIYKTAK